MRLTIIYKKIDGLETKEFTVEDFDEAVDTVMQTGTGFLFTCNLKDDLNNEVMDENDAPIQEVIKQIS